MGRHKCVVFGCSGENPIRRRFPHPVSDGHERYPEWLRRTANPVLFSMTPKEVYDKKYYCDLHFTEESFIPNTKKLKKNSLPTLNLPPINEELDIAAHMGNTVSKHKVKSVFSNMIHDHNYMHDPCRQQKEQSPGTAMPLEGASGEMSVEQMGMPEAKFETVDLHPDSCFIPPDPMFFGDEEAPLLTDSMSTPPLIASCEEVESPVQLKAETDSSSAQKPVILKTLDPQYKILLLSPFVIAQSPSNPSIKIMVKLDPFPEDLTPAIARRYLETPLKLFSAHIPISDSKGSQPADTQVKEVSSVQVPSASSQPQASDIIKKVASALKSQTSMVTASVVTKPIISQFNDPTISSQSTLSSPAIVSQCHQTNENPTRFNGENNVICLPDKSYKKIWKVKAVPLPTKPLSIQKDPRFVKLKRKNKNLLRKVERLKKNLEKKIRKKISPAEMLEECKELIKPWAYEILSAQLKIGCSRTKTRGVRWSEGMKKIGCEVYTSSTYAFKMFSYAFFFPSMRMIKRWLSKDTNLVREVNLEEGDDEAMDLTSQPNNNHLQHIILDPNCPPIEIISSIPFDMSPVQCDPGIAGCVQNLC